MNIIINDLLVRRTRLSGSTEILALVNSGDFVDTLDSISLVPPKILSFGELGGFGINLSDDLML